MPVKFGFKNPFMMTWLLLHQTYNSILKCEDRVFSKHGITTEQHSVLIAIKYIKPPVTPTEVARWLDRNTNSVSLIVDRTTHWHTGRCNRIVINSFRGQRYNFYAWEAYIKDIHNPRLSNCEILCMNCYLIAEKAWYLVMSRRLIIQKHIKAIIMSALIAYFPAQY